MSHILEGKKTKIVFDEENGNILSLTNLVTDSEIISEKRLTENFRLFVPLPHKRGNYVYGRNQKLSKFEKIGDTCKLFWNQVIAEEGKLDIDVTLTVKLDDQKQEFNFNLEVKNKSNHVIEEVWYPVLSGLNGIGKREDNKVALGEGWTAGKVKDAENIFTRFPAMAYYYMRYPFTYWQYPEDLSMQWTDIYNTELNEGIYIGSHDESCQTTIFYFELHPCVVDRYSENAEFRWPEPEELNDEDAPIGLLFSIIKMPFIESNEKWMSPDVVIKLHQGDWHQGADRYREWAQTWMEIPERAKWVTDGLSWQTVWMGSPDRKDYYYKDIPDLAQSAIDVGINTLQLIGIHKGGQDVNYPDYSPDPILGGPESLKKGIEEANKLGVHVGFFVNAHVADKATDWYKKELYKYVARDKYGNDRSNGYAFNSVIDILPKEFCWSTSHTLLAYMCPTSKEWQDIQINELHKLVQYGISALQLDKIVFSSFLCYDPNHGHKVPESISIGMLKLIKKLRNTLLKTNPEFSLAGETAWDAALQYLDIAYTRTSDSMLSYTFPEFFVSVSIDESDYESVNTCLTLGANMNFELLNLRGHMKQTKKLGVYVKWVLQIRKKLADYLINGRFVDHKGATIEPKDEKIKYGVHINEKTGKKAIVIMNKTKEEKIITCNVENEKTQKYMLYQNLKETIEITLPLNVRIEPNKSIIIVES